MAFFSWPDMAARDRADFAVIESASFLEDGCQPGGVGSPGKWIISCIAAHLLDWQVYLLSSKPGAGFGL